MNYDITDGQKVAQTNISQDYVLDGTHKGTINVLNGQLTVIGCLMGSLNITSGATAVIVGEVKGSTVVESGSHITILGALNGSAVVQDDAYILVEETGKLAGALVNQGTVIVRGVFGGSQIGDGEIILDGNGYIKNPVIKNGISHYDW